MMTMATSTTAATPPWCQHIKNCTSTPSPSLGESFALKVGTRGNNSQKNILQQFYGKSLPGFPRFPQLPLLSTTMTTLLNNS